MGFVGNFPGPGWSFLVSYLRRGSKIKASPRRCAPLIHRFFIGNRGVFGVVFELIRNLAISPPPSVCPSNRSIFAREIMGFGWQFRRSRLTVFGFALELGRNYAISPHRRRAPLTHRFFLEISGVLWLFRRARLTIFGVVFDSGRN